MCVCETKELEKGRKRGLIVTKMFPEWGGGPVEERWVKLRQRLETERNLVVVMGAFFNF